MLKPYPSFNRELALSAFESINLKELDKVRLMNRTDTKFIFHINRFNAILKQLKEHYYILEVANCRLANYKSLYYDSEDLWAYHKHHNGHLNRYKVRFRQYVESDLSFFEIKFKSNKSRTIKERIVRPEIELELKAETTNLIDGHERLSAEALQPTLWIYFKRLTLASKDFTERVTIDVDLSFENYHTKELVPYPKMVIAEVKQEKFSRQSPIIKILHQNRVYPYGMSKYCLGIVSCFPEVKQNRFKKKILRVRKMHQV